MRFKLLFFVVLSFSTFFSQIVFAGTRECYYRTYSEKEMLSQTTKEIGIIYDSTKKSEYDAVTLIYLPKDKPKYWYNIGDCTKKFNQSSCQVSIAGDDSLFYLKFVGDKLRINMYDNVVAYTGSSTEDKFDFYSIYDKNDDEFILNKVDMSVCENALKNLTP